MAPSSSRAEAWEPPQSLEVLGVRVDRLTQTELFERVENLRARGGRHLVAYANAHTLNQARSQSAVREAYQRAALTYCDGGGVQLGARLTGGYLPERLTAASFIDEFCERWGQTGARLFFLGGERGVAEEAAANLGSRHPGLRIVGHHHGMSAAADPDEAIDRIRQARPDILFVGLGTPLQERWILDHWERLDATVVWPVGALLDYVSGRVPRCPQWMQRATLEWLFRFGLEPRRMFRRYAIGNPLFLLRVLRQGAVGR